MNTMDNTNERTKVLAALILEAENVINNTTEQDTSFIEEMLEEDEKMTLFAFIRFANDNMTRLTETLKNRVLGNLIQINTITSM